MITRDGWLGYAHSRYSRGDYYVSVRLTKEDRELLDEFIEARRADTSIDLPSVTLHSLAFNALREWKRDSLHRTKIEGEE